MLDLEEIYYLLVLRYHKTMLPAHCRSRSGAPGRSRCAAPRGTRSRCRCKIEYSLRCWFLKKRVWFISGYAIKTKKKYVFIKLI